MVTSSYSGWQRWTLMDVASTNNNGSRWLATPKSACAFDPIRRLSRPIGTAEPCFSCQRTPHAFANINYRLAAILARKPMLCFTIADTGIYCLQCGAFAHRTHTHRPFDHPIVINSFRIHSSRWFENGLLTRNVFAKAIRKSFTIVKLKRTKPWRQEHQNRTNKWK